MENFHETSDSVWNVRPRKRARHIAANLRSLLVEKQDLFFCRGVEQNCPPLAIAVNLRENPSNFDKYRLRRYTRADLSRPLGEMPKAERVVRFTSFLLNTSLEKPSITTDLQLIYSKLLFLHRLIPSLPYGISPEGRERLLHQSALAFMTL